MSHLTACNNTNIEFLTQNLTYICLNACGGYSISSSSSRSWLSTLLPVNKQHPRWCNMSQYQAQGQDVVVGPFFKNAIVSSCIFLFLPLLLHQHFLYKYDILLFMFVHKIEMHNALCEVYHYILLPRFVNWVLPM